MCVGKRTIRIKDKDNSVAASLVRISANTTRVHTFVNIVMPTLVRLQLLGIGRVINKIQIVKVF
jgi:hypothetical protein